MPCLSKRTFLGTPRARGHPSERTGDTGDDTAIPEFVYRNIGPGAFEGITDVGREAAVPQRAVKHPGRDAEALVGTRPSEERVLCGMPADMSGWCDRQGEAVLERP